MNPTILKSVGFGLLAVSMFLIMAALNAETTAVSISSSFDVSSVHNIGLMQQQMVYLHLGIGGFVAGTILLGCGTVAERLGPPTVSSDARNDVQLSEEEELEREEHRRAVAARMLIAAIIVGGLLVIATNESWV